MYDGTLGRSSGIQRGAQHVILGPVVTILPLYPGGAVSTGRKHRRDAHHVLFVPSLLLAGTDPIPALVQDLHHWF